MRINSVDVWTVDGFVFEEGYVSTPMAPGLGCELDLSALVVYQHSHETINL